MTEGKGSARLVRRRRESRVAGAVTRFSGSFPFVVIHVVWFAAWVTFNVAMPSMAFDAYPFGLLTLIVSLEAIFLSTFVLIQQNQQADTDDAREWEDFNTDLYAEVLAELTAEKVGVERDRVEARVKERLHASSVANDDGTPKQPGG